jgi:predicted secreted acid phosphatase
MNYSFDLKLISPSKLAYQDYANGRITKDNTKVKSRRKIVIILKVDITKN